MSIAAILIADECGPDGAPIALYRWDSDRSLIEYEIEQILDAGVRDIEVVLGADADRIIPLIGHENVEAIVNPSANEDEASAIRVGASAVPRGTSSAIITSASQPRPRHVYAMLLDAQANAAAQVTRPWFERTAGEPVVVSERMLEAMRNLRGANGLERLLAPGPAVNLVAWRNELVIARVDSEAECAAFRERYGL